MIHSVQHIFDIPAQIGLLRAFDEIVECADRHGQLEAGAYGVRSEFIARRRQILFRLIRELAPSSADRIE